MMMSKPIIGITADINGTEGGCSEQLYVATAYVQSVELAGGLPIMLPVTFDENVVSAHANLIDGLLLSGGVDINPLLYGEEPQLQLQSVNANRDWYEVALVRAVIALGKPIFGICRGVQMLNVACGGTLWQDVYTSKTGILQHRQLMTGSVGSHTVRTLQGSLVAGCLTDSFVTNSFHHQACKDLAPEFMATAWSADGIIEAIERTSGPLVFGVQWHPERMTAGHNSMLQLFRHLIVAAGERRDGN